MCVLVGSGGEGGVWRASLHVDGQRLSRDYLWILDHVITFIAFCMDGATFPAYQHSRVTELNDLLQLYLSDSSNYEKSDVVSFLNIIVQAIV